MFFTRTFRKLSHADLIQNNKLKPWIYLLILTISIVYFSVFMEWIFFITKPSFMDVMGLGEKIEVLFITGLITSIPFLLTLGFFFAASYLPFLSRHSKIGLYVAGIIPAVIMAITALLLIDNFTYTVFRFGVITTRGFFRAVYGALFLVILDVCYEWVLGKILAFTRPGNHPRQTGIGFHAAVASSLILASSLLILPNLRFTNPSTQTKASQIVPVTGVRRPNILLLGSDGLDAGHMSVYGYERDTTPFLRTFVQTSLLAENAFTNGGNTTGSTLSILTGKLPTTTRVIYPPDILRNSNSYQHLPGILRQLGYQTIQITVPHYADAYTVNMLDGFDVANERSSVRPGIGFLSRQSSLQDVSYFLSVITERISDRLLHIFLIRTMSNPIAEVSSQFKIISDQERIDQIIGYFANADRPLFMHVHLMGTHGDRFKPESRVFSAGQSQDSSWMTDFFDDTILDFDGYVRQAVDRLGKMGVLDNTILILYTDHNMGFLTDKRIPLIIRFPHGEYAGRIHNNVQNLDIAPTILDYLGVSTPDWFEGQSLLDGEPDPVRPIFSTAVGDSKVVENGLWSTDPARVNPPFYQFVYLQTVVCHNRYRIDLKNFKWSREAVVDHTTPCKDEDMPDTNAVQGMVLDRLGKDGFDVSALKHFFETLDVDY